MATLDYDRMRELYQGGLNLMQVAQEMGCSHQWVSKKLRAMDVDLRPSGPGGAGVAVAPFREAFLRMEPACPSQNGYCLGHQPKDAANRIAARLGWYHDGMLDGPRVRRVLGLRRYPIGHGGPSRFRQYITYAMAVRLCEAMDLDPHEMDL